MRPERRLRFLLVVAAVTLAAGVYQWWPRTADPAGVSSNGNRGTARRATAPNQPDAPDVHLDELNASRTKPGDVERNLFRFRPKPAPAPPPIRTTPPVTAPAGPPPPPPLPPIALKFIGVIESENAAKIAILSDGRGAPVYGKEGETVLGQYRILRIGAESIEMSYMDGRGRQSIRLSGS